MTGAGRDTFLPRAAPRTARGGSIQAAFTHTTAAGQFRISGLPFAAANVTGNTHVGMANMGGWTKASYTQVGVAVGANLSYMTVIANGSGQPAVTLNITDFPTGGTVAIVACLVMTTA